jgi:hypothetical protein
VVLPDNNGTDLFMQCSDKLVSYMRNPLLLLLLLLLPLFFFFQPAHGQNENVVVPASTHYGHPFFIEKKLVGDNYRQIWTLPVTARVFHMNEVKGGLQPVELGGGMQTKSLHMKDKQGKKWVLRSIDKTVDKAMKAMGIKNSGIRQFSQQMISAAQPYGPLTLPPMAKALGILSTKPELYYVEDDPGLGKYRELFAHSMCLLEEEQPVFYADDKVISTEKMLKRLKEDKTYRLDEKMLLQARLLDMLAADWDRHGDQWKWEVHQQEDGTKMIYPIPRDHDQAYFNSNGLVFNIIRLLNMHTFVGFRKALRLKALNYKEWSFDKSLLQNLTEESWRRGIASFQQNLTDAVLDEGVHRLPVEVYRLIGPATFRVLQVRRDKMMEAAMDYYRFLQTHPAKLEKQAKKMKEREKKARQLKEAAPDDSA